MDGYGNLDKNVVRNWKATVNTDGDKIPGKWVTVTMQVVNNKAGKLTINIAGVPEVVFEAPASSHAEKVLQDRLFLQFHRVNVEVYDYRVVAGVNVSTGAPAQPANPANAVISADPVPAVASESGTVLYYQRFGSGFDLTLGNVGLIFPSLTDVSFTSEGYLTADSVGKGTCTFALLPVALSSELGSYTLECTFRFSNPATYKQGCMILNVGGVNVEMRHENDATFGATGSKKNNWLINPNTGIGKWITMKLIVTANEITSVELTASGETIVYSGETLTQPTKTIPETGNIALACYHAGVQLGSVRLVSGVDYTQYLGSYATKSFSGDNDPEDLTFPETQMPPSIPYEEGKVLYYQFFDKNFELSDLSATGLTVGQDDLGVIGSSGYLEGKNIGFGYGKVVILPDVIPAGLTTYTVETTFRFTNKDTYGAGGVQIGWGEGTAAPIDINLRYYQAGKFDKVGTVDENVALSWLADFLGPGNWITLKVSLKDGKLFRVTVTLEDVYLGQTYSWVEESPEYQGELPMLGQLFIQQGNAQVQYRSIRLVEGTEYTEYTGEYATKSHSGHADPLYIDNSRFDPSELNQNPSNPSETGEVTTESPSDPPEARNRRSVAKIVLPIVISLVVVSLVIVGVAFIFAKRKKD